MSDVAALQAELAALQEELNLVHRNNELFSILILFIVVIAVTILIHMWGNICAVWQKYAELVSPAEGQPPDCLVLTHDIFNLFVLPGVVILDFNFLFGENLDQYYNPNFWIFFWYTVLYVIVDMLWVALFPKSVKSSPTIIMHHGVTLLYLGVPAYNPLTRYVMAADLLVELNTWLLILRRQRIARHGILHVVNSLLFYVTWFSIRCIAYPYLIFEVYGLFVSHVQMLKDKTDPAWLRSSWGLTYMMIPPIFQTTLTILNVHWSIQLIKNTLMRKGPAKGL